MRNPELKLVTPTTVLGNNARKVPPRRRPNKELRAREYLTVEEMDRLLKAVKKNRYSTRDYALLLLMARHGFRVSEAITLRRDQIDFATSNLAVRRLKNGSPSTHPLGGIEVRALRKLFRESPPSAFVFVSNRGAPLTRSAVQKIFAKAGRDAGLSFRVHPHMARHHTGFALCNRDVNLRALQSWLGHKQVQHTTKYAELAPNKFRGFWDD
jgi:integrase